ncbi:MAG: formylglycine-generating enzyme family protein [Candidatus Latescibacter sp.]|nr:formylglycine-generating enzyme family protein [Candidatus Latescibacter sp.]
MKRTALILILPVSLIVLLFPSCSSRGPEVKMVSIPAGSFSMGKTGIAEPVHTVTLSAFSMSAYEITQGQFKTVIRSNMPYFKGLSNDNLPMEKVSWWEAIKYCNALNAKAGLQPCYNEGTGDCDFTKSGFRLPTEAEWEYACRGGTTTNYYTGDTESDLARAGWYFSNSSNKSHPVGRKTPNAWGLYDMHGNAWEWCNDWYEDYTSANNAINPTGALFGSNRIVRGGAWYSGGSVCRSAARAVNPPSGRLGNFGFRVVRRP